MIQRFSAGAGGLNSNVQILFDFGLADELRQPPRAQLQFKRRVVLNRRRRDDPFLQVGIFFDRAHWPDTTTNHKNEIRIGSRSNVPIWGASATRVETDSVT